VTEAPVYRSGDMRLCCMEVPTIGTGAAFHHPSVGLRGGFDVNGQPPTQKFNFPKCHTASLSAGTDPAGRLPPDPVRKAESARSIALRCMRLRHNLNRGAAC